MSLSADAVIRILEGRYDYYSARIVLKEAAVDAGLDPKGPFDAAAAKKLATAVSRSGSRVDAVVAGLRAAAADAGGSKKAPAKKAPAKAAPSPEAAAEEAADAGDAAPAGDGEGGGGGGAKRSRRKKS